MRRSQTTGRWLRATALAVSVLAGGCRPAPATAVVVVVWSDLTVPIEIDGVHVGVSGKVETLDLPFALSAAPTAGRKTLPLRVALTPRAAKDESFSVRVAGSLGTTEKVTQEARVAFLPGQARILTLFLGRACQGVTCPEPYTCDRGQCNLPKDRKPEDLPKYDPGKPPSLPDAGADASVDAADARDTPGDGGADTGADLADATADAAPDALPDAPAEAAPDTPVDTPVDVAVDPPPDLSVDSPAVDGPAVDAPVDAASEKDAAVPDAPLDPVGDAAAGFTDRTPMSLPPSWPAARNSHAVTYDSARGKLVLYGGTDYRRDTWEYDPSTGTWADRTPSSLPASWPPGLDAHTLDYDAARAKVVLFGGRISTGPNSRATWEWDGDLGTWTDRTPSPVPSTGWPPARSNHASAYDSSRHLVVVFGGLGFGTSLRDLWEWDGAGGTWTDRTPSPVPSGWPGQRFAHAMTHDPGRKRIVMFSGVGGFGYVQDLWEWDGATGAWTDRTPASIPASWPIARGGFPLVHDPARGVSMLYGGEQDAGPFLADLWEWNGGAGIWIEHPPASPPSPWPGERASHAGAWDVDRGTFLLFGGRDFAGAPLADVWEWR